jgi:methylmalonyl-CoA mutase N-terminal domain/subunit
MYTERPWTMRQYAGFGTAAESNARYQELIGHGTTGLSVAFDLPTQMGFDSDAPRSRPARSARWGWPSTRSRTCGCCWPTSPGRGVDLDDHQRARGGAVVALPVGGRGAGCAPELLTGTIQNDVLKEYIARGTYIYPPQASLRLVSDTVSYCREHLPRWNTISISGYHMAEAGATPAQEVAFTLANGIAYVEAALAAGLAVDDFAPRLSFFFVSRTTCWRRWPSSGRPGGSGPM